MSRSNKEEREQLNDAQNLPLGSGLLDRAKKSMGSRKRMLNDALEEAETGKPAKKKFVTENF